MTDTATAAPIANPEEVEFFENNRHVREGPLFLMWYGAYGSKVYVWADSFDSAFETFVEWLDDNAPGMLVKLSASDYKNAAKDLGLKWRSTWPDWNDEDFQKVAENAEVDLTSIGHTTLTHGTHIASHEWAGDDVDKGSKEWDTVVARSYEMTEV